MNRSHTHTHIYILTLPSPFPLRILVVGERCNVAGENYEVGSTSE